MNLEERIVLCKKNPYELNNIIEQYKPFILGCVQRHVGRFVTYGKDDELSIGMIAFEEAIRAFNNEKGSFLTFAESIIKRRLIDYYRKESKHANILPFSAYVNEEEDKEIDIAEEKSVQMHNMKEESNIRQMEVSELTDELSQWGISFEELVKLSPKQNNTKKQYKELVHAVINNNNIYETLKLKKYLPVNDLEIITKIPRKTIERARKYIIAMTVILTGDYNYIRDFINWR